MGDTKVVILMARHEMRTWVLVWTGLSGDRPWHKMFIRDQLPWKEGQGQEWPEGWGEGDTDSAKPQPAQQGPWSECCPVELVPSAQKGWALFPRCSWSQEGHDLATEADPDGLSWPPPWSWAVLPSLWGWARASHRQAQLRMQLELCLNLEKHLGLWLSWRNKESFQGSKMVWAEVWR